MREDISKWIEALRSGEYKQAQGALQVGDGYCCLGVYCKVHGMKFTPARVVAQDEEDFEDYEHGVCEGNFYLYGKLRLDILDNDVVAKGIEMNDEGKSFAEIADMIEEHYLQLEANEDV